MALKPPELLSKNIRAEITAGQTTISAVAERAGMSQPQLSRVLSAEQDTALSTIFRVAEALGIAPWRLLLPEGEDSVPKSELEAARAQAAMLRDELKAADSVLKRWNKNLDRHKWVDTLSDQEWIEAREVIADLREHPEPDDELPDEEEKSPEKDRDE